MKTERIDVAKQEAQKVLQSCRTDWGLLASPKAHDNYQRIWARDSVIASVAAIISADDASLPDALTSLKLSVETLRAYQADNGQIPSNVDPVADYASYGTLVGRVDATTWWIIGTCIWLINQPFSTEEDELLIKIQDAIKRAHSFLQVLEYNQRGLIYTPLGGNWADEYICEGYTLYDNCLRLWALELSHQVCPDMGYDFVAKKLRRLIVMNFFAGQEVTETYHPTAYQQAEPRPYGWFKFGPAGYDTRFDMAANALALLLDLNPAPAETEAYGLELAKTQGHAMLPVFYPIIRPGDQEWPLLKLNYLNNFKNKPYHFHNGGSWPVFKGLMALGLGKAKLGRLTELMNHSLLNQLGNRPEPASFAEYWASDTCKPGGVTPLAYTAAGLLMLTHAAENDDLEPSLKKIGL